MGLDIPEKDWKVFKRLREVALERFCKSILAEIVKVVSDESKEAHLRYLAVFKLVSKRDKQLASAFDDLRRSTALLQLTLIHRLKLLSDEEILQFTAETQRRVTAPL